MLRFTVNVSHVLGRANLMEQSPHERAPLVQHIVARFDPAGVHGEQAFLGPLAPSLSSLDI